MSARTLAAALALAAGSAAALAGDTITLFGTTYSVTRIDIATAPIPDPLDPNSTVGIIEVEGIHYLGDDRLLFSSDAMDFWLTVKNWVIDARLQYSGGQVVGIGDIAVRVLNDLDRAEYGFYDLSPAGITVNSGPNGLGRNGGIVVSDSEVEAVRGFDAQTPPPGNQLQWPEGSGCRPIDCFWPTGPFNVNNEDIAYVAPLDRFYTLNQEGPFTIEAYDTSGNHATGFVIVPPGEGDPKGLSYLPDSPAFPAPFQGRDILLVALDDEGPGLVAYDFSGNQVAFENLDGRLDSGTQPLQLESCAGDPATGRLFLMQQGNLLDNNFLYILTPACPADFNNDGAVDSDDFFDFLNAFNLADPSADFNGDGLVDSDDFFDFLNAFNAGC